jgi:hypothetical protein
MKMTTILALGGLMTTTEAIKIHQQEQSAVLSQVNAKASVQYTGGFMIMPASIKGNKVNAFMALFKDLPQNRSSHQEDTAVHNMVQYIEDTFDDKEITEANARSLIRRKVNEGGRCWAADIDEFLSERSVDERLANFTDTASLP